MLWALTAAAVAGLLLGLWFRVAAIVAASGIAAAISSLFALSTDQDLLLALVITFALLLFLQVGYLAGVMLSWWFKARLSRLDSRLGNNLNP